MSIYVPNVGEKEMLRGILCNMEVVLGLFANEAQADGSLTIDGVTELLTGGGRQYAPKTMPGAVVESALTADKWYLNVNSSGSAQGQHSNAALSWIMGATDVADGATIYGAFGYIWALPFDGGVTEIKPGDEIKGGTGGATATVAMVNLLSGTWGSTAAGLLWLRSKSGTFQNDENIIPNGQIATVAIGTGGTGYAVGDIVTVTQTGGAGAKVVVTTVNAGVVTGVVVVDGGQGYAADTGLATTKITGAGNNDLTLDIATVSTTAVAVSNTGTTNGGDAHKRLLFVDTFTDNYALDTVGLTIEYTPKLTLASA